MKKLIFSRAHLIKIIILVSLLSCSTASNEKEEFQRSIPLQGQVNFRDLGNYITKTGEKIKPRMIYRSGTLARLSDMDKKVLDSLGIKTVINFLDEGERQKYGEDRLPKGVKNIFLPIAGQNNEVTSLLEARQTGNFSKVPVDFNYQIHALLTEDAKEEYAVMFHLLADSNNYPIVFHCSHGVHRTGTASALILTSMGVPWETVREDYLLSNECRMEESEKRITQLEELASSNPDITDKTQNKANIEAFYILHQDYIDGTKIAIDNNYGDIHELFESMGISDAEIANIQQILII